MEWCDQEHGNIPEQGKKSNEDIISGDYRTRTAQKTRVDGEKKEIYSSITLVDPFYGGSSFTTKFSFESFETQYSFSNSPDGVPIVFIFVEKKFKAEKRKI